MFSGSFLALFRPRMLRTRPAMADSVPKPMGTKISEQTNQAMANTLVLEEAEAPV